MKCPKCGKEIADDSKFCEFCGSEIITNKPNKQKNKGLWFSIIAFPFILLFFFYFVIDNPKCHKFDFKGCNYMEIWDDNVLLGINWKYPLPSFETPYHLKYKYAWIYVNKNGTDQQYASLIFNDVINGGYFAPKTGYCKVKTTTNWFLHMDKPLINFEEGKTYNIEIGGVHKGILFDRKARDLSFTITIPLNTDTRIIWLNN